MSSIMLDPERVREMYSKSGIVNDKAFAEAIGVDKGTASRVLSGQAPGPKFISSVLLTFPVKFEDVFLLVDDDAPPGALAADTAGE